VTAIFRDGTEVRGIREKIDKGIGKRAALAISAAAS
jgi:hypothetical protein